MATQSITVTFNPTAEPHFTFSTGNPYLIVDEVTTVELTLIGATFSTPSVIWSIPPSTAEIFVSQGENSSGQPTITFTVPAPIHYFKPWVFRISVDTPGVLAIRSPNIFLTNVLPLSGFNLEYTPANGNFSFMDTNSDPTQDGLISADELILINAIVPPSTAPPSQFNVALLTNGPGPTATFAATPVLFSNSTASNWITATPVISPENPNPAVQIAINSTAYGQSTGLRFQIVYNGVTFFSPDPILINTTIGDG